MAKIEQNINRMVRPQKRYILGVCEALGRKYKISPILFRISFIVTTNFFVFPPLIYIIMGLYIPNYKIINDKKKRNLYQIVGLVLGGLLGAIFGFFGPIVIFGMISGISKFK